MPNDFDLTKPWFAMPTDSVVPQWKRRPPKIQYGMIVTDEYLCVPPKPPVSIRKVVLYTLSFPLFGFLLISSVVTMLAEIMNDNVRTYWGTAPVFYAAGVAYVFITSPHVGRSPNLP
jgi:hypothetical protein